LFKTRRCFGKISIFLGRRRIVFNSRKIFGRGYRFDFVGAEAAAGARSGMDLNGSGVHGRSIGTIYLGTGHGRPVRMEWRTFPRGCRNDAKDAHKFS